MSEIVENSASPKAQKDASKGEIQGEIRSENKGEIISQICSKNGENKSKTSSEICGEKGKISPKKLTQRDIAGILRVDTKTLYNWRKHKPELYQVVMLGFKFKELLEKQRAFTKELENMDERIFR